MADDITVYRICQLQVVSLKSTESRNNLIAIDGKMYVKGPVILHPEVPRDTARHCLFYSYKKRHRAALCSVARCLVILRRALACGTTFLLSDFAL
uniref:Uncharacterized protein n=1 Tax=Romanomermis culicivorax TaxID=13658 RepID=A0A915JZP5_ROMCU